MIAAVFDVFLQVSVSVLEQLNKESQPPLETKASSPLVAENCLKIGLIACFIN